MENAIAYETKTRSAVKSFIWRLVGIVMTGYCMTTIMNKLRKFNIPLHKNPFSHPKELNPFYGKKHTKEVLEKLSKKNIPTKGWKLDSLGYKMIFIPEHPFTSKSKYMYEHRLVMERYLGRYLLPMEVIHHKNGDILDNRIENLQLFECNGEHIKFHRNCGGQ
jgi:hypothetical protein